MKINCYQCFDACNSYLHVILQKDKQEHLLYWFSLGEMIGYDFINWTVEFTEDEQPEPRKIYLAKYGNKLKYTLLSPENKKVDGVLDVDVKADRLTKAFLESRRIEILNIIARNGHTKPIENIYYKENPGSIWMAWMFCILKAIKYSSKEVTKAHENNQFCPTETISAIQGFICMELFINKLFQPGCSLENISTSIQKHLRISLQELYLTDLWCSWLECFKQSLKVNINNYVKLKKLSIYQCFLACYEYIKYDCRYNEKDGTFETRWKVSDLLSAISRELSNDGDTDDPAYWEDWIDMVNYIISKGNVEFASNDDGVTLEQGLECVRMFVDQYYFKNKDALLIEVFKDLDLVLKNKETLKDSDIWKSWVNCFKAVKLIDSY